ncbi:phasin family protein [Bradyrhizobium hereditatis]|uniref:phasin family protein n=1 Tax=Bradyrhizobium hereditatis TaxID=2821405 RepID=UPI001CE267F1|nr:phasin family protein [Bradyrhizobium hereditatis]
MSTTDDTKPAGKSGRRKGKGERKKKPTVGQSPAPVELQSPEPVQPQSPDQTLQPQPEPAVVESPVGDQPPLVAEPVEAVAPVEAVTAAPEPTPDAAPSPAEPPTAKPAPAEPAPVSLQTIANAYRDYTRKSFEEFGSFVEQLSGVRSLDKAMTVQTEFMKRAYETSVSESQRICELHTRLARQTLDPFKGLAGKAPPTQGKR